MMISLLTVIIIKKHYDNLILPELLLYKEECTNKTKNCHFTSYKLYMKNTIHYFIMKQKFFQNSFKILLSACDTTPL